MTYCVIYCTTASKEDATEISKHLIKQKLIACCNIIPNITSIYEWKEELCIEEEYLLIMKTKEDLYNMIEEEIKKSHKYETPEIICLPIQNGSKDYLDWITKQVLQKK